MKKPWGTMSALLLLLSGASLAQAGAGLPNPAAKFCVDQGGTLKNYVLEDGGAISLCAFNDDVYLNGLIEEWTYFRYKQEGAAPSMAVKAFFDHVPYKAPDHGPVGHPALRYCQQLGGQRPIIIESSGDESGVCQFEDGSVIEEWTLFRGPEVHKSLAEALKK